MKTRAIPQFIDMYNHLMGGVDQADQLWSYYTTLRAHHKNWKCLWHFLLNTLTNSYKIARYVPEHQYGPKWRSDAHRKFYECIAIDLFSNSERLTAPKNETPLQSRSVHRPSSSSERPWYASPYGSWPEEMLCLPYKWEESTRGSEKKSPCGAFSKYDKG